MRGLGLGLVSIFIFCTNGRFGEAAVSALRSLFEWTLNYTPLTLIL